MIEYGKHLEGGEACVFARVTESRTRGLRTMVNMAGRIIKKWIVSESEFTTVEQKGWIERENHRTVEVGFSSGGKPAFSVVKKARVTLV